jgi:rubredoxin
MPEDWMCPLCYATMSNSLRLQHGCFTTMLHDMVVNGIGENDVVKCGNAGCLVQGTTVCMWQHAKECIYRSDHVCPQCASRKKEKRNILAVLPGVTKWNAPVPCNHAWHGDAPMPPRTQCGWEFLSARGVKRCNTAPHGFDEQHARNIDKEDAY